MSDNDKIKTDQQGVGRTLEVIRKSALFYDGKCPVCAREIAVLAKMKDDRLNLIDLHSLDDHEHNKLGLSKHELATVLHLRTGSGQWLKGLDATVQAWRHTRVGWLFLPLRWKIIAPLADRLYLAWAKRRICSIDYVKPN